MPANNQICSLESFSGTFAPYLLTFAALLCYTQLQHKLHLRKPLLITLAATFFAHYAALVVYDTRPNPNFPPIIVGGVPPYLLSLMPPNSSQIR